MTEIHVRVRYTEPMLRRAVRTFMWRRIIRRSAWLFEYPLALALLGAAVFFGGYPGFFGGVWICAALVPPMFVAVIWRAHSANTLGRFRATRPPEADFTFRDADVTIRSPVGSAVLPWSAFTEVWELDGFWMVFTARSQFNTWPLEALSAEDRSFVRARLPRSS